MEMSILLEQFNLDPLANFKDLDPFDYFKEDGNTEFQQYYQEVTTGTTKNNVFQKLWDFILRGLKWIAKQFNRLLVWIKNIFSKGRYKKTADQIVDEVISSGFSDSIFLSDSDDHNSSLSVSIPSSHKSDTNMNDMINNDAINVVFKSLKIKFTDEGKFNIINAWDIDNRIQHYTNRKPNASQGPVKGKTKGGNAPIINILVLLNRPDILQLLEDAIKTISSNNYLTIRDAYAKFENEFNGTWNFSDKCYSIEQCMEFQVKLNNIIKVLEDFHSVDDKVYKDNDVIQILNKISLFVSNLQMCMNALTSAFTNAFIIDRSYYESFKDINALSLFVEKCIESGMPHKYIAYNTYLVSSKELKGDGSNGDENNPIWGQSRVVLFPHNNKDIVYKVALSRWGIGSNKTEYEFSKKIESKAGHLIALTKDITKNGVITTMERLPNSSDSVSNSQIESLKNELSKIIDLMNLRLEITDIHKNNVAYKGNNIACIDYGWAIRK